jgi:hypothetical protein
MNTEEDIVLNIDFDEFAYAPQIIEPKYDDKFASIIHNPLIN